MHQLFKLLKLYHFRFCPSNNSINYLLCSIRHVRRLIYSVIVKTHKYGTWHALKRDAHVWKIGYLFLLKHANKTTLQTKEQSSFTPSSSIYHINSFILRTFWIFFVLQWSCHRKWYKKLKWVSLFSLHNWMTLWN